MLVDEYVFKMIIQGSSIDEDGLRDIFIDSGYDSDYIPCGTVMSKSFKLSTSCETFSVYKEYDSFDYGIKEFMTFVLRYSNDIKRLRTVYKIRFLCFINADNAQIEYIIPKDAMQIFAELDIDICFSVLSWGLIEE